MPMSPAASRPALTRLLTSPLLAMVLVSAFTLVLLTDGHVQWALVTAAVASGVSLSGST